MTLPAAHPHQTRAFDGVMAAVRRGDRHILVHGPTGCGKTRIAAMLAEYHVRGDCPVSVYTNRKLLVEQLAGAFAAAGLDVGVRAAEYERDRRALLQVSMVQTEASRTKGRPCPGCDGEGKLAGGRCYLCSGTGLTDAAWKLHPAVMAIVDESHLQQGKQARDIVAAHLAAGAAVVEMTATPLDLLPRFDAVVPVATMAELRACGMLVPCLHYGCDEPDLRTLKKKAGEDYAEKEVAKRVMTPTILGRVIDWYRRLNPAGKPTILFAPGVAESLWFAEQFAANGIPAAHIDGENVWVGGRLYKSDRAARREVLDGSEAGDIRVVTNRYVLREGVDAPWLAHGVLATAFGSLQSYLQSGGRLLRGVPGLESVTLQDHGGNWWRHGSLNAERTWHPGMTAAQAEGWRAERLRRKIDTEPRACPRCALVLLAGRCRCGWEPDGRPRSRAVVQLDGSLRQHVGDIFPPRAARREADTPGLWKRMYFRAKNAGMTFAQARALFFCDHGYWPPDDLPLMPADDYDWFRCVGDVPAGNLVRGEASQ